MKLKFLFNLPFLTIATLTLSLNANLYSYALASDSIKVTVTEGTNMAAAISPDHETIAIDLQGRLWLLPISGGSATPITDEYGDARQPAWSPDGEQIAFQGYWEGSWHIYIIDKDGSNLRQLTNGIYDHREPHWSNDGRKIACSSDRAGTYDIWTIDLQTNELTQVTDEAGNEYAPAWSADDAKLAYISDKPDNKGIFYYSFLSKSTHLVCKIGGKLSGVSWQPDGTSMTFTKHDFDESLLMQVMLDSKEVTFISKGEEDVFPFRVNWLSITEYIYTADGKIKKDDLLNNAESIVPFSATFDLHRPSYSSKKHNFDEGDLAPVKGVVHPNLAPNGKDITFIALNNIWIQNERGELIKVTDDTSAKLSPVWAQDGLHIFYASDKEDQWAMYRYHKGSKEINKIGDIPAAPAGIALSNDGKTLAYTVSFGPRLGRLETMHIASGESKRISGMVPSSLGAPTWSADNKTITLTKLRPYSSLYREGVNRLLFYNVENGESVAWKALNDWSFGVRAKDGPVWSPDGKHIAVISHGFLWIVPVSPLGEPAGLPIRLTNELADVPSWSGDSKYILYTSNGGLKKIDIQTGETQKINIELKTRRKSPEGITAIHVKGLFNGVRNEIIYDKDILIEGNRIIAIEDHDPNREADKKIDASKSFAMPGLIDIHSHQGSWDGKNLGKKWLAWGVTATRDPATDPYDALNRKEATDEGSYLGPRVFFTGSPIDGNRIYYGGSYAFQSPAQIALEMERASVLDYDMIKTYVRLPDPLQKSVIEKAHQLGLPVTSHEIYPATAYGIDGVEHIAGTSRRGYSPKITETLRSYEDVTKLIAESGMSFTPTAGIYVSYNYLLHQNPQVLEDPRLLKFETPFNIQNARMGIEQVKEDVEGWKRRFKNAAKMIKDISDRGGLISAGTDGPILPYGFGLHMELEAYAAAGLSNFEVLRSATVNNARVLGAEKDMGTLEAGKLADLIIVKNNPLDDIKNLREIEWTIVNGRIYSSQSLLK